MELTCLQPLRFQLFSFDFFQVANLENLTSLPLSTSLASIGYCEVAIAKKSQTERLLSPPPIKINEDATLTQPQLRSFFSIFSFTPGPQVISLERSTFFWYYKQPVHFFGASYILLNVQLAYLMEMPALSHLSFKA
mgnify:CR=1 FL=1